MQAIQRRLWNELPHLLHLPMKHSGAICRESMELQYNVSETASASIIKVDVVRNTTSLCTFIHTTGSPKSSVSKSNFRCEATEGRLDLYKYSVGHYLL